MAIQMQRKKLWGNFDGISCYPSVYGWMARMAGGPSRTQFKKSASFARARENSSEFTVCAKVSSEIRREIILYTQQEDKTLYHRLMKLMRLLANDDTGSLRGQRDPRKGMETVEGQVRLKEFKIKRDFSLYDLLFKSGYLKMESVSGEESLIDNIAAVPLKIKDRGGRKKRRCTYSPRKTGMNLPLRTKVGKEILTHLADTYLGWRGGILNLNSEMSTFRIRHKVTAVHHMGDG